MLPIEFQSTQPKRAATISAMVRHGGNIFQSTQPKRAATAMDTIHDIAFRISIHAAQEGCDATTTSQRRRRNRISIHAARMGCDCRQLRLQARRLHFNPRSPNGLRRYSLPTLLYSTCYFNPRSPNGLRLAVKLTTKRMK